MARVVQKQKNPLLPVLVVFVFLFLISATLAVIFFNQADKAQKTQVTEKALLNKIANSRERKIPVIETLIKEAGTRKGKLTAPTAVGALYKYNQDLSSIILGTPADNLEQVDDAVAALRADLNSNLPLLEEAKQAHSLIKELQGQITTLQADKESYNREKEQFIAAGAKLKSETSTELAQLQGEKQKATERASAAVQRSLQEKAALDRQYLERFNDKEKENQKFIAKIQEQELVIQSLEIKLAKAIGEKQKRKIDDPVVAIKSDGIVRKVFADHPVCFIPLGAKDKIVRGMTFRVYGPEGIPQDGSGYKAGIVVTDVLEYVSQCRIEAVPNASPVSVGDLFANIAYDPAHTSTFVIEGDFDLFGTGRATKLGAQQVADIIKRSGGRVSEELTVRTDYLVLGEEPAVPDKPEEDASEAVRQDYEDQKAVAERYQRVLLKAKELRIPVLNTNRFLALTGYNPRKTLQ